MTDAEKSAIEMVGDGGCPNMYWVTMSQDWLTNVRNQLDESNCYDSALEAYGIRTTVHGVTLGPFTTFRNALRRAQNEASNMPSPEVDVEALHSVSIEDRLSGTLYDGTWQESWGTRTYMGETLKTIVFAFEWRDDTKFTREKMARRAESFV